MSDNSCFEIAVAVERAHGKWLADSLQSIYWTVHGASCKTHINKASLNCHTFIQIVPRNCMMLKWYKLDAPLDLISLVALIKDRSRFTRLVSKARFHGRSK